MSRERTRRAFLAASGAALAGLAGCVGGGGSGGGSDGGSTVTEGEPGDPGTTPAPDEGNNVAFCEGTSNPCTTTESSGGGGGGGLGSHPAAAGVADQPRLGPPPGEAKGTIVAFEDPSCPRCRVFEEDVVPKIESELAANGKATFVFRGYPVVYQWGEPATRALEATYARSSDAFWALKDHYYGEQDAFSSSNVLSRTESFLAAETDVDAASVVSEAENTESDAAAAVRADLDAGQSAGATATPTVYLFRGDSYRTKAQGSVSFSVLKATLGL